MALSFRCFPPPAAHRSLRKKDKIGVEYHKQSEADTVAAVTEIFGGEVLPPDQIDPEIEALFLRIGNASRDIGKIEVENMFSVEAMIEALESAGMLRGFKGRQRQQFETGFRKGFEKFDDSLRQMAFDRHRILRVEAPSNTMRVVFVQHYDTDLNIAFPMRWWLAKTNSGWRVFDFQDLSTGLRSVELMGIMMSAGVGAAAEPWIKDFLPVLSLMRGIDMQDPEQVVTLQEPLEKLRENTLPASIRSFASTMMVAIHAVSESTEELRAELEAAVDGGYQSPLWHYQMASCLMAEERFDEAIKELEKHAETFGWDSDSLELLSDSHLEAGRPEEARAAALRGLEDSPGAPACLASLAAASTPDQLRDPATAALFALSNDSEAAYEMALDYLIDLEFAEQTLALFEVFRKIHPDSELIEYYEDELGIESEAPAEE